MDIEEILYKLKHNRLGKKALNVVLTGCLMLVILVVFLLVIALILAFKYHTQIYDVFVSIINFVFGDSPDNVIRGFFKQIGDNFLKNLFNGE